MAKYLLAFIALLVLLVWLVASTVSNLLADAPFLLRAAAVLISIALTFSLLGKLVRLLLTRLVTGFSGKLQSELKPAVRGELVEARWIGVNQWEQSDRLDLDQESTGDSLRIRLRLLGSQEGLSGRVDPSAFSLSSADPSPEAESPQLGFMGFKGFAGNLHGQPGSIGDAIKALGATMGVPGETADWVRLLDASGVQRYSGEAQAPPPSSAEPLPLLEEESRVELRFNSLTASARGQEFRLSYRLQELFVLRLPVERQAADSPQRGSVTLVDP